MTLMVKSCHLQHPKLLPLPNIYGTVNFKCLFIFSLPAHSSLQMFSQLLWSSIVQSLLLICLIICFIVHSLKFPSCLQLIFYSDFCLIAALCFRVVFLTSNVQNLNLQSTLTQQYKVFHYGNEHKRIYATKWVLRYTSKSFQTNWGHTSALHRQTSVILQSRLCPSPSEKVWGGLPSSAPCGPRSEGDERRAVWGRRGEEDQRRIGNGKSSREDTWHNLRSLFCLSSYWLPD